MQVPPNIHAMVAPRAIKMYINKRMNQKMIGLGLTASTVPFLFELEKNEGTSLKEITAHLSVDKALTTRTIRQLIDKGFAEDISENHRSCKIVLTSKGRDTVKEINTYVIDVHNDVFTYISEEEFRTMMIVMEKVYRRICEKEKDLESK
ncbi:MAG: MarR family winged helix-turn-helix transcriptional regulator [Candidatus Methanogranum gryphiswaldense]|nr:MAG: MarR family winged helix-turn-helix transcriptional regulator [Candidatus Methanogranum sp. U3.2.1]